MRTSDKIVDLVCFARMWILCINRYKNLSEFGIRMSSDQVNDIFFLNKLKRDSEIGMQSLSKDNQKKGRAILSEQEARAIFQRKPSKFGRDRRRANLLAKTYGVSVKAIRDIWVGRTWYRSTCYLDQSKPVNLLRLLRKPGRPLGAKDSKPRILPPARPTVLLAAPFHCPADDTLLRLLLQAPTPTAAELERESWPWSVSCDDPFHDDWPFWPVEQHQPASTSGCSRQPEHV